MKYLITSFTKEINLIAINMRGERDKVCVKISSIPHCICTFRVKNQKLSAVILFLCFYSYAIFIRHLLLFIKLPTPKMNSKKF